MNSAWMFVWLLALLVRQEVEPTELQRLEYRLQIGDWQGSRELARRLANDHRDQSTWPGALVNAALWRGALESGELEEAVLPFLRLQTNAEAARFEDDAFRGLQWRPQDAADLVSRRLPPIFFDPQQSNRVLDQVLEYAQAQGLAAPPGWRIYAAGLARTAGRPDVIERDNLFDPQVALGPAPERAFWQSLFAAAVDEAPARTVALLDGLADGPLAAQSPTHRAALDFIRADIAERARGPHLDCVFAWLQLAVDWRTEFPDLAAAALDRAVAGTRALNLNDEAETLERELRFAFPNTFHGKISRDRR